MNHLTFRELSEQDLANYNGGGYTFEEHIVVSFRYHHIIAKH